MFRPSARVWHRAMVCGRGAVSLAGASRAAGAGAGRVVAGSDGTGEERELDACVYVLLWCVTACALECLFVSACVCGMCSISVCCVLVCVGVRVCVCVCV